MNYCLAAFCAGVIILHCTSVMLPWFYYFFVIAVALLSQSPRILIISLAFALGAAWTSASIQTRLDQKLPTSWEGLPVILTGYACSLPVKRAYYSQVEICGERMRRNDSVHDAARNVPFRIRLSWSNKEIDWTREQFQIETKLKRPSGTLNPHVFAYEKYLFYRGVTATGSIKHHKGLGDKPGNWADRIEFEINRLRMLTDHWLRNYLSDLEHGGLIRALILGDKSQISVSDASTLRDTGTQHLLAISGLHVGLVMLLIYRLSPKNRFGFASVVAGGLLYIVFVGFGPSAQRAFIMCIAALMVLTGRLKTQVWRVYWSSMALVLLLDPLAPMNLGFWYSFGAVALLLLVVYLRVASDSGKVVILTQGLILLALFPINAVALIPQGIGSGLANLVAIPWVSLFVLPVALLTFLMSFVSKPIADWAFVVLNEVLHVLMVFLDAIPGQPEVFSMVPTAAIASFLLIGLMALFFIKWRVFSLTLLIALLLFLNISQNKRYPVSELWVLDVGQGLSLFIQHRGKTWVYDLGPAFARYSSYESTLLPFFQHRHYAQTLNGMVVSHGDNDHAGRFSEALVDLDPAVLWMGEPERLGESQGRHCVQGQFWDESGLRLEVLFPNPGYQANSANNRSCVVRLTIRNTRFLIMGDLEGKAERALLNLPHIDLQADILIAGHHGSNNATSRRLLVRVQPSVTVFSAGYRNRFGHPHRHVLARVEQAGSGVLNTAEDGAISFNWDQTDRLQIATMRQDPQMFWQRGFYNEKD